VVFFRRGAQISHPRFAQPALSVPVRKVRRSMKGAAIHLAFFFVVFVRHGHAARGGSQAHPVTKVINLLKGLMAKTEMMGKTEAASYAKFTSWCQEQSGTLKEAIGDEKDKISELEDTVAGKTKEQKSLENQIDELSDQIAGLEADGLKAKKVRDEEAALYKDSIKDFEGTIKAVGDALAGLKKAGVESKKGFFARSTEG
jgi:polyhydroxyalkanoate synthesis regulator phasin